MNIYPLTSIEANVIASCRHMTKAQWKSHHSMTRRIIGAYPEEYVHEHDWWTTFSRNTDPLLIKHHTYVTLVYAKNPDIVPF